MIFRLVKTKWLPFNFKAYTLYNNWVLILPDYVDDRHLIRHELEHIHQMNKHGRLKFTYLYLKEQRKHGYEKNLFECQARGAEHKIAQYTPPKRFRFISEQMFFSPATEIIEPLKCTN